MGLEASGQGHEKILLFAQPKCGKTSAHLSIAKMYQMQGKAGLFHWIDTDRAAERMLNGPRFRDLENVRVYPARDFGETEDAVGKALANLETEDDWIVADQWRAWEWAKEWYTETQLGETPEEYTARKKKEGAKGWKLFEEMDWDLIKPKYQRATMKLWESAAHVMFVVEEKTSWEDQAPNPAGHATLPYQVHTILRLAMRPGRDGPVRTMTTFGDRERDWVSNEPFTDFALHYLCKIGGWRLS